MKEKVLCTLPFSKWGAIEIVDEFKWLGITIDRNMIFKAHIRQLKRACAKRLNIMKMLCGANFGPKLDFLIKFCIKYIRTYIKYIQRNNLYDNI